MEQLDRFQFKPKSKLREFLGEKFIALNAYAALIAIILIFIFIFKEAIPIFADKVTQEEFTIDLMIFKQTFY